jgi:hypothetical protein
MLFVVHAVDKTDMLPTRAKFYRAHRVHLDGHGAQPPCVRAASRGGFEVTEGRREMTGKNRITIFGPKDDGSYVVEFRTADGEVLSISTLPGVHAARSVRAGRGRQRRALAVSELKMHGVRSSWPPRKE